MALMPKRVKYRNVHRGKMRGVSLAGSRLNFGDYGLKAMDRHWLTGVQIEAARVALTRQVKRGGKIWIRVFPDKPITKKPLEVRMGKGKGPVEGYVFVVKPGRILFEIAGVPEELAKSALRLCAYKLPFRTKFIRRGEIE